MDASIEGPNPESLGQGRRTDLPGPSNIARMELYGHAIVLPGAQGFKYLTQIRNVRGS
ncbi:hypothetical protein GCM10027403_25560 [Arthrobacter tecti]